MRAVGRSYDIAEFSTRDGIDPAVALKLNHNFKRLAFDASKVKTDQEVATAVFERVAQMLVDTLMPVGTIIVVDNLANVPGFGQWEVCDELVGRYVKAGMAPGTGGRQSFTISEQNLPSHSHKYDKASIASTSKKFKEDTSGTVAASALSYTSTDTTARGSATPSAINLDPLYGTVIFVRRVA